MTSLSYLFIPLLSIAHILTRYYHCIKLFCLLYNGVNVVNNVKNAGFFSITSLLEQV